MTPTVDSLNTMKKKMNTIMNGQGVQYSASDRRGDVVGISVGTSKGAGGARAFQATGDIRCANREQQFIVAPERVTPGTISMQVWHMTQLRSDN